MDGISSWFLEFMVEKIMELTIVEVREAKEEWAWDADGNIQLVERRVEINYCIKQEGAAEYKACYPDYKKALEAMQQLKRDVENLKKSKPKM